MAATWQLDLATWQLRPRDAAARPRDAAARPRDAAAADLAARQLDLATWELDPATWQLDLATWQLDLATWQLDLATWQLDPATWQLDPGTWQLDLATPPPNLATPPPNLATPPPNLATPRLTHGAPVTFPTRGAVTAPVRDIAASLTSSCRRERASGCAMSSSAQATHVIAPKSGAGRRRKLLVHAVFGAVGLVALGLLVRGVGPATLFAILRRSAHWLPVLFAIDALRVVAEAVGTRSLSERVRRRVPLGELARIHIVAYAVAMVMPAGRATGEAVKATMLARHVGAPEAAAVGAANQSTSMLGGALGAIPCAAAALWLTGPSRLTGGLAAFVVVTLAGFAALQIACRRRGLAAVVLRRFTRMKDATTAFQNALERIPVVPWGATLAALASRALLVVELGVLLLVLGGRHGPLQALVAHGVGMLGGTLGDLVPGQLGAMDGAFALAAPTLGLALVDGVAVSVMLHCVQALWAVGGWVLPLLWKARAHGEAGAAPALLPRESA